MIGPVEWKRKEPVKNAKCCRYMSCLNFAVEKNWLNFSCTACSYVFKGAPCKPEPMKIYTRTPFYRMIGEGP